MRNAPRLTPTGGATTICERRPSQDVTPAKPGIPPARRHTDRRAAPDTHTDRRAAPGTHTDRRATATDRVSIQGHAGDGHAEPHSPRFASTNRPGAVTGTPVPTNRVLSPGEERGEATRRVKHACKRRGGGLASWSSQAEQPSERRRRWPCRRDPPPGPVSQDVENTSIS